VSNLPDNSRPIDPAQRLRPNAAIVIGGTSAIAVISAMTLPWTAALASTVLGALMLAGADIDARTYLLPDIVTLGALLCGILAAAALDPYEPWRAIAAAIGRSAWTACALALVRWCYAQLRGREGLGFGDIKLAAAAGAWLPLESIPVCFALAAGGGLIATMTARLHGQRIDAATKLPFGAFLCPALWLAFYSSLLSG
jgi:leader peptidase (prepilin peptidase) / N-methyltransferase